MFYDIAAVELVQTKVRVDTSNDCLILIGNIFFLIIQIWADKDTVL